MNSLRKFSHGKVAFFPKSLIENLKFIPKLLLAAFFSFTIPLYISTSNAATESSDPNVLRIGYLEEGAQFHSGYKPKEHFEERFKILSKYLKNEYSLHATQFVPGSGITLLKSGAVNVFAGFAKSPQRMYNLKFSKNPIFETTNNIVAHQDKNIAYGNLEVLKNKSIAILSSNTEAKDQLSKFLKDNNIVMHYKVYTLSKDYINSDADFKLTTAYYMAAKQSIVVRIGQKGLYFATLPENEHLLKDLDYAIEQANKHDVATLRALNEKFITKSVSGIHKNLSPEEQKLAKKDIVYKLAYIDNHFPIQYKNNTGQPDGITISVLNLFHQMRRNKGNLTSYNLDSAIDLKKFDMLFSIVGNTALKEEYFYASDSYLNLPMVLFKKEGQHKLKTLGMLDYSTLSHEDVQKNFPYWKINIFKSLDELFDAYKSKEIDVIFLSESEAEYGISTVGIKEHKLIPTIYTLPLKFYLSKKYPPVAVKVLNSYISKLNPVALQEVILKAEHDIYAPSTPLEFLIEYKYYIMSIVGVIMLLMLGVHFLRIHNTKKKYYLRSKVDSLTGLHTKAKAFEIIEHALSTALPDEYMMFCVDVDNFALLNQVYGSSKADEVLCYFANFHKTKYSECHVARLRDDVFLVFGKMEEVGPIFDSHEDILTVIHDIKEVLQSDYNISASRGCYVIEDVTLSVETMINYCNIARYSVKDEHGLSTAFFDKQMEKTLNAQKEIIYKMERGIENNEFVLNFQPKVNAKNEQICGAEVLVRWQAPDMSTIYPNDFISVFEKNAFISTLDIYVFEKTCKFIQSHRGVVNLPVIAMNFSSISLLHVDTITHIRNILDEYQVSPSEIEIEITESAMVIESSTFTDTINQLCNLGFSIAIDDFGTGVSSLHRLNSLQIHTVKLDKAFLDNKFTTKRGIYIVANIIRMLKGLGIQIVAEGVETKLQLNILQKLQCDIIQGYYFYKPMDSDSFVDALKGTQVNNIENVINQQSSNQDLNTYV